VFGEKRVGAIAVAQETCTICRASENILFVVACGCRDLVITADKREDFNAAHNIFH